MEQKLLFSKLDNTEKTLVRSRLMNRSSGKPGWVNSRINFVSASDKLESNLITETPLCDVIESFVYPRSVQTSGSWQGPTTTVLLSHLRPYTYNYIWHHMIISDSTYILPITSWHEFTTISDHNLCHELTTKYLVNSGHPWSLPGQREMLTESGGLWWICLARKAKRTLCRQWRSSAVWDLESPATLRPPASVPPSAGLSHLSHLSPVTHFV